MYEPNEPPTAPTDTGQELPHLPTAEEERRRINAITDRAERLGRCKRREAEIDRLGDEIAMLSAQIQAATYELLARIAEFDRREGWADHGARSCAHWLVWRIGLAPGPAREWVRVARALEQLPLISEGLRQGEISFSKVRALTRIATPETERPLVELARAGTAAHVERIVRACRRYGPQEEQDRERRMHALRYVDVSRDGDGMFLLRARLDPEAGVVLMRAIDAANEALYEKTREVSRPKSSDGKAHDGLTASQRRADALALRR